MKKEKVSINFIIDRSGSMGGLEEETIKGFNSLIAKQKEEKSSAIIKTVLFSDDYQVLHDGLDVLKVKPMTKEDYYVTGCTALYDAIGKTVNDTLHQYELEKKDDRPSKVLFVITTDGYENASQEYNKKAVKGLIDLVSEKYKFEFLFIGANIDSSETAESIGIKKQNAANYEASEEGTTRNYRAMSSAISSFIEHDTIGEAWLDDLNADYLSDDSQENDELDDTLELD